MRAYKSRTLLKFSIKSEIVLGTISQVVTHCGTAAAAFSGRSRYALQCNQEDAAA